MRKVCRSPHSRVSGSRPVATLPLRAAERRHDVWGMRREILVKLVKALRIAGQHRVGVVIAAGFVNHLH